MPATLRMVVVDQSSEVAQSIEDAARECRAQAIRCSGMSELFRELLRLRPDLAVVDARLCDLGGIGVVRAARVLAPDCEVVLTSIDPTSETGLEAIRAGALECVLANEAVIRVRAHLARLRSRTLFDEAVPTLRVSGSREFWSQAGTTSLIPR
jgi:DNA-binding response OmpR family regulator